MADYHRKIADRPLPVRPLRWGALPGRSGELIMDAVAA
jgi:hypothetical protein